MPSLLSCGTLCGFPRCVYIPACCLLPCAVSAVNLELMLQTFLPKPRKWFVFNDGFGRNDPWSARYAFDTFLPALFPHPSQYELPDVK